MSMLNQLFNRGLLGVKWLKGKYYTDLRRVLGKTCLTLAISRINLLQNKREAQLKTMKKEIAQFLVSGQESIARIRVEHVIREQSTWESYEIIELFCEFVLARVPILESQSLCRIFKFAMDGSETIKGLVKIFKRNINTIGRNERTQTCGWHLPDLLHVRNLFAAKYGKEFIAAATELRPDTSFNRTIIEKLTVSAPPPQVKLRVLKEITLEHNVDWDSTKLKLNSARNPKIFCTPAAGVSESSRDQSLEPSSHSSDVLQLDCTAIAAAELASASARAAAELVNANFSSLKLMERKSR
ncbi:uncharacterized protein [Primulina huaijiensis]|uniref:uncharacterized protein isoform X2 n=1 Tax=Primulina huaijiensis TaxID=1492673 RepID=UPI003CC6F27C